MSDAPNKRLPKVEYLLRVVDAMLERGATRVSFGDFSADFIPNFAQRTVHTESIEPPTVKDEAKEAIKDAFEKVKRLNQQEEEDLFWST